jgi:hypothetical protein
MLALLDVVLVAQLWRSGGEFRSNCKRMQLLVMILLMVRGFEGRKFGSLVVRGNWLLLKLRCASVPLQ